MVNFLSILQAVTAKVGAQGLYFQCHQRRSAERLKAFNFAPARPRQLGHSFYLHARPNTSSALKLDEGIFR
jgi:hypothetical protein